MYSRENSGFSRMEKQEKRQANETCVCKGNQPTMVEEQARGPS